MTTDNDLPLRDENIPRSARITAETEGSTPRKMASRGHNLQPRGPAQSEQSLTSVHGDRIIPRGVKSHQSVPEGGSEGAEAEAMSLMEECEIMMLTNVNSVI